MDKLPYISVAVTLPVMNAYTYQVPAHLQEGCAPGVRVLVPFGRRRITGYVLSWQARCDGFEAKNILDILDEHPLFSESQIRFFKWISDYYIHPLGDVIKSALPSGFNRHDVSCVFATQQGTKFLKQGELTPGEAQVLEFVLQRDACPLKVLKKNIPNPTINALVRKMEQKGLIQVSAVLKADGPKVKKEKFILLGDDPKLSLRMSKKREKILALVKEHNEISLTRLKEKVPTASSLIKPLVQAGHIRVIERSVFRDPFGDPVEPDSAPRLTLEQESVIQQVESRLNSGFCPYLLWGVTGSGKTEVYLQLARDIMEKGGNVIVLVPEISLISQTERRFRARFGNSIAVIHSSLTQGELLDQWRKIALNKVNIVIGARSAVFAPFDKIGLIIVDEEHDSSYKQENGLRYNARDLAVVRAKLDKCPVFLGSATPSVQSYQNVVQKKFELLSLKSRVNNFPLPGITLVDLKKYKDARGEYRIVTPELSREIRQCLDRGKQALIFLNRRGFATFPLCTHCGKVLSCRHCDVSMTLHKGYNAYKCHLCGYTLPVNVKCPGCGSKKIKPLGFGTEKIESIMKAMFPDARLARMDQDSTSRKGATLKILKDIRNHNVDIIVGTQMLAKGHDFPSITLVGVICADLSLNLPDFRAGERTFQLLAQVAGRAGRGDTPGKVIMQTYNPGHFIIEASQKQDFFKFFQNEAPFRKALMYPPFSRMIQLKISGTMEKKVKAYAFRVAQVLKELIDTEKPSRTDLVFHPDSVHNKDKNLSPGLPGDSYKRSKDVQILGPIEAGIQKISSHFRWQILLKSPSAAQVNWLVKSMMDHPDIKQGSKIKLIIDVDPYFFM